MSKLQLQVAIAKEFAWANRMQSTSPTCTKRFFEEGELTMTDLSINPDFDPDDYDDPEPRRGRGFLATDVNILMKEFLAGEWELPEGKFMSPYTAARILKEKDDLEKMPSSGAVARIFHQWEDWGYAIFRQNPFAFVDFTPAGKEQGLQAFVDANKQSIKKP